MGCGCIAPQSTIDLEMRKIKSFIINSPEDVALFKNIIKTRIIQNLNFIDYTIKIIFRASRSYFSASEFHEVTDGIPNTILVVKSENGNIFGGFTPCKWKKDVMYKYVKDQRKISFLFKFKTSHEKRTIQTYELFDEKTAIQNHAEDGPIFGSGRDINIVDRCDVNDCWCNIGKSYESQSRFGSKKSNQLMGGSLRFKVTQYEIWQISQILQKL